MSAISLRQSTSINPFVQMCTNLFDFARAAAMRKAVRIATLGPPGTSSEYAASCFARNFGMESCSYYLYDSYEDAAESVVKVDNDLLLVANAYGNINKFYISDSLRLTTFFVLDTLPYGLAAQRGRNPLLCGNRLTVATHPAPSHLAGWLAGGFRGAIELQLVESTSKAAKLAADGAVDACITNDYARSLHDLAFISPIRTIQMVWSVFKREIDLSFPHVNSINGVLFDEIRTDN